MGDEYVLGIAAFLWLAGFFIARFNTYNLIVGEVLPIQARIGWLPYKWVAPLLYRIISWILIILSVAVPFCMGVLSLHWAVVLMGILVLLFISSFLASVSAWRAFARKYPDSFAAYKAKKELDNMMSKFN